MDETYRQKVWDIINTIQSNQLFVHSSNLRSQISNRRNHESGRGLSRILSANGAVLKKITKPKIVTKKLPEILTICVLNALVPNSAMLDRGTRRRKNQFSQVSRPHVYQYFTQ